MHTSQHVSGRTRHRETVTLGAAPWHSPATLQLGASCGRRPSHAGAHTDSGLLREFV